MTISAIKARSKALENLREPAIKYFVEAVDQAIERACEAGRTSIDPLKFLAGLRMSRPTPEQVKALRQHYESHGYKWEDHPDPDPGHPASRPYTTLSW